MTEGCTVHKINYTQPVPKLSVARAPSTRGSFVVAASRQETQNALHALPCPTVLSSTLPAYMRAVAQPHSQLVMFAVTARRRFGHGGGKGRWKRTGHEEEGRRTLIVGMWNAHGFHVCV